jgi:hypothetical protein
MRQFVTLARRYAILGCLSLAVLSWVYSPRAASADAALANITCDGLHISLSSNKDYYIFTATASGDPAAIIGYTFDYGDRQSYTFTFARAATSVDHHQASVTHIYRTAGTYTAKVHVNISSAGKTTNTTSVLCQANVVIAPAGTRLPNAGSSLPISMAVLTAFTAALLAHDRQRRLTASHTKV